MDAPAEPAHPSAIVIALLLVFADLITDDTTDCCTANGSESTTPESTEPPTAPTPAPMAVLLFRSDIPAHPAVPAIITTANGLIVNFSVA